MKLLSTITAIAAVVLCTNAAAIEDVSNAAVAEAEGFSSVPSLLEARQDPLPTFNEWTCAKPFGGPGHSGLKKIHAGFNRVFGKNALVVASGQCYVANCHNLFFALCNTSGITLTDSAIYRERKAQATETTPGIRTLKRDRLAGICATGTLTCIITTALEMAVLVARLIEDGVKMQSRS
ncbi:hypothetical protein ACJZ2D_000707 [Fusarium nematophilum]